MFIAVATWFIAVFSWMKYMPETRFLKETGFLSTMPVPKRESHQPLQICRRIRSNLNPTGLPDDLLSGNQIAQLINFNPDSIAGFL